MGDPHEVARPAVPFGGPRTGRAYAGKPRRPARAPARILDGGFR
ncbi:hypothetical protein SGM_1779 [Streptomyces griseoaurantiacus M045]|uniref:Uncharacterized protein n=1 Tax=Streptomyces griseoaurantiacus M045 TaxID=996637 RepID=F3NF65_9ACTN|nr:hypothetical protein SGM_1779 [Streptomyces griseoaurantiacus M045]